MRRGYDTTARRPSTRYWATELCNYMVIDLTLLAVVLGEVTSQWQGCGL